jgi:hypothetical protein
MWKGTMLEERLKVLDKMGYYTDLIAVVDGKPLENRTAHANYSSNFSVKLIHKNTLLDDKVNYLYAFLLKKDLVVGENYEVKEDDIITYMYPNTNGKYTVEKDRFGEIDDIYFNPSDEQALGWFYTPKVTEEAELGKDGNDFNIREVSNRTWEPLVFSQGLVSTIKGPLISIKGSATSISPSYLLDKILLIPYM